MTRFLLALMLLAPLVSSGRESIPLMPPMGASRTRYARKAVSSTTTTNTRVSSRATAAQLPPPMITAKVERERSLSATGYGFELGVLGRDNKTQANIAGMQLLYGGRVFSRISVMDNVFLVPSLGAFFKRDRAGNAGVNEYLIEAGAALYYNFWLAKKLRLLVGGTAKVGYDLVSVSAGDSNSDSAGAFRVRGGPAAGLALGISPDVSLTANFELTLGTGDTMRIQPGLALGAIFYLQ